VSEPVRAGHGGDRGRVFHGVGDATPAVSALATDTGQATLLPAFLAFPLGAIVLFALIGYVLWSLVDLVRYGRPGRAAIWCDVAAGFAAGALALQLFGLGAWWRFETAYGTCSMARDDTPGRGVVPDLTERPFPPTSTCHWSDGHTDHLVPQWLNPTAAVLLAVALIAAVAAFRNRGAVAAEEDADT